MGLIKHRRHSKQVTATRRWQVLRHQILERDGWKCRNCGARGRLEIDHIKSVRLAPESAFDPDNLQALCPTCHTKKTRIECGHPAPVQSPERDAWAQAVADLAPVPSTKQKDTTCLTL
jgi:5-methylcytosine-specific restriction enzyme A